LGYSSLSVFDVLFPRLSPNISAADVKFMIKRGRLKTAGQPEGVTPLMVVLDNILTMSPNY
jgi:hypothetical protein